MLRAEIAHLACEQIARGGLLASTNVLPWVEPMKFSHESEEDYRARRNEARVNHLDSQARVMSANDANLDTCKRAVAWLRDAGDDAAASAVQTHIRQQWGRFAAEGT